MLLRHNWVRLVDSGGGERESEVFRGRFLGDSTLTLTDSGDDFTRMNVR